ncbi:uncharacterized protein LOC115214719 [Argonauta hians]
MPRKRQIKTVRCCPALPEGDEGKDLTEEQKQMKLQAFLDDFDRSVDERIKMWEDRVRRTLQKIDTSGRLGLQQIPKSLRKMKLRDFIANGGSIDEALQCVPAGKENVTGSQVDSLKSVKCEEISKNLLHDSTLQNISADCEALQMLDFQKPKSTVKKTKLTARQDNFSLIDKPLLEDQVMLDEITKSVKRTLRRTRNTKNTSSAIKDSSIKTRSSRRIASNKNNLQTPSTAWPSHYVMTPAITPKFDPRLPMTPFDRSPRHGERFMSFAGSPVVVRSQVKINKIKERISAALMSEAFEGTESLKILNEMLEVIEE